VIYVAFAEADYGYRGSPEMASYDKEKITEWAETGSDDEYTYRVIEVEVI
jgi:hypothetical protein